MTMTEDEMLRMLADTLLPGGEGFPPASATGTVPLLAVRLRVQVVADLVDFGQQLVHVDWQSHHPRLILQHDTTTLSI